MIKPSRVNRTRQSPYSLQDIDQWLQAIKLMTGRGMDRSHKEQRSRIFGIPRPREYQV